MIDPCLFCWTSIRPFSSSRNYRFPMFRSQQQDTNKRICCVKWMLPSADRKRPTKMTTDSRLSFPKLLLQEIVVKRKRNELAICMWLFSESTGRLPTSMQTYTVNGHCHSVSSLFWKRHSKSYVAGYTTTSTSPATTWCCGESSNLLKDSSSTQQQRFFKALWIEFDPNLFTYYQLLEIPQPFRFKRFCSY